MDPKTLRYAETHEWAALAGDIVTIGVTAFAADQLGDVTLVEFKKPGAHVEAKGSLGEIEAVKSVSDVYAPVAGEVIESNEAAINAALNDDSKALATDPVGKFWLVKLKVPPGTKLEHLKTADQYAEQLATEGH
jgi:glycine cleavage system H protein